jgi:hypothetical protein
MECLAYAFRSCALPTPHNVVKHFGFKAVCERSRQKSPSLREGRALWPGEDRFGDHHLKSLRYRSPLPARSSRPSRSEGEENDASLSLQVAIGSLDECSSTDIR